MITPSNIERIMAAVDKTLRREFPDDFCKRCAYSAFAICRLLRESGTDAHIVGGNFAAFVVSTDGKQASMQGYGYSPDQPAHFWVETESAIIDLGLRYLPHRSSYAAAQMPPSTWNRTEALPAFLRYQPLEIFPADARMSSDATIEARSSDFIEKCKTRYHSKVSVPKLGSWLLTGSQSVAQAALKQDPWARNALKFAAGNFQTGVTF